MMPSLLFCGELKRQAQHNRTFSDLSGRTRKVVGKARDVAIGGQRWKSKTIMAVVGDGRGIVNYTFI